MASSSSPERRTADANGAAHRFSQMSTPAVLPGSSHRGGEVADAVRRQEFRQLRLGGLPLSEFPGIGELGRLDGPVRVFGEDQDIDQADGAGAVQPERASLADRIRETAAELGIPRSRRHRRP